MFYSPHHLYGKLSLPTQHRYYVTFSSINLPLSFSYEKKNDWEERITFMQDKIDLPDLFSS